jgi:hypothetical protein
MKFAFFSKVAILALLALIATGCRSVSNPSTLGEESRWILHGYTPLDPLPVGLTNHPATSNVLQALPDETMRLAIGTFDSSGNLTYGPARLGTANNNYEVILDYIKYSTKSLEAPKITRAEKGKESTWGFPKVFGLHVYSSFSSYHAMMMSNTVIVPVYVGIGLRLRANIYVKSGEVDLSNLLAIGVAAQAKKVTGSLVVQTLGISGENISTLIPMPGEINVTTIQNAIMALGTIKSKIYDSRTSINPRVIAVYNNFGGGSDAVNMFISDLLKKEITLDVKGNIDIK